MQGRADETERLPYVGRGVTVGSVSPRVSKISGGRLSDGIMAGAASQSRVGEVKRRRCATRLKSMRAGMSSRRSKSAYF
jgi:hypothetical protein